MVGMIPERNLTREPVAVDLGAERPMTNPVEGLEPDVEALKTCTDSPMCIASIHHDEAVCRPDDACWTYSDAQGTLNHVSHGGACWHEVDDGGRIPVIQAVIPVETSAGPGPESTAPDSEDDVAEPDDLAPSGSALVTVVDVTDVTDEADPFTKLRDDIYDALREEGNPPMLSTVLATVYAQIVPAQIPETMSMLRGVGESISGVLGGVDGEPSGFVQKMIAKAMRGNG